MTRRTFVRPEAQIEISEAIGWYENQETGLGRRFLREIRTSLELIAKTPFRFPTVGRGVRRSLVKRFPYSAYFVTENETVIVIAVLHLHRYPGIWKDRL
jgi:plasmid stabilization system protein ParE